MTTAKPKQKLPRTHKELQHLLEVAAYDGYKSGRNAEKAAAEQQRLCAERDRAKARLDALKQVTQLADIFGQLINTVTEAMKSEAGQL